MFKALLAISPAHYLIMPFGVGLNIPPFLGKKQQLYGTVVVETLQIVSLRIHLERVIRRVKEFSILTGVMSATFAGSRTDSISALYNRLHH